MYKIEHLFEAIDNYLKTENGQADLIQYVVKNNLLNEELIKEILNYGKRKNNSK